MKIGEVCKCNDSFGYIRKGAIVTIVSADTRWALVRPASSSDLLVKSVACTREGNPDCVYVSCNELEAVAPDVEWRLPAGTFFRVANSHTPLYLVMSNSHVFNLTEKQMHTTCSPRFKDKQLSVANVTVSEVL